MGFSHVSDFCLFLIFPNLANFRGDMMMCYHERCDNLDIMLTDDNIKFLGKTADSITQSLHLLSEPYKTQIGMCTYI